MYYVPRTWYTAEIRGMDSALVSASYYTLVLCTYVQGTRVLCTSYIVHVHSMYQQHRGGTMYYVRVLAMYIVHVHNMYLVQGRIQGK